MKQEEALFKSVAKLALHETGSIYVGYEMDCLISSEFTPAPSFKRIKEYVEQLLSNYHSTYSDFMKWLQATYRKCKHPYGNSDYYDLWCHLKEVDFDDDTEQNY